MLQSLTIEPQLIWIAALLVVSVAASKVSDRFGIPALLLFLGLGMLAGSEGIGGIYFDDPAIAQYVGVVALIVILFSGGLDTSWDCVRSNLKEGLLLSTVGVVLTAVFLGWFAHVLLHIGLTEGILLGAIVSSTDAAAVFSILRAHGVRLKGRIRPLLELESGSNDPVAVFLTIGLIQIIQNPERGIVSLIPAFLLQMGVGLVFGFGCGKIALFLINRLRLGYAGLYPVMILGIALFTYAVTNVLGGSGFLAVYLAGLVMGREDFIHKRSLLRFFDGIAWLMQISMFLTLGLLVFPSKVLAVVIPGLLISLFLMFVARPLSVLVTLLPVKLRLNEKIFTSWVGLRGAVPIVLATYPRIAGLPQSDMIFDIIFFVVLTSVLIQGTSLPWAAKLLGVEAQGEPAPAPPIQFADSAEWKGILSETIIRQGSWAVGKAIYELGLPGNYLIVLITRAKEHIVPNGAVVLQAGDRLLGLSEVDVHEAVETLINPPQ